jgi:hypothetical protein
MVKNNVPDPDDWEILGGKTGFAIICTKNPDPSIDEQKD